MWLRDELLRRFPALTLLPPHSTAVGGAIRDILIGRKPADVDVECDDPEGCARLLGKAIPLGRGDLRVYRVVRGDSIYDFSGRTDLRRRDFTINAIALDLTSAELQDPFEGEADIRRRAVRMIRWENFQDDPLRMLRGVRLALQFDFTIEEKTVTAIRRRAAHVVTVAAERVTYELNAIFSMNKFRTALLRLSETGLDEPLFGYAIDAERFHADDVSCAGAFALLLRDPGQFAERWKWSRELLREVTTLQRLLREPDLLSIYEAGERIASELPALFRATNREVPPMPDLTILPLLDGNEIARITGLAGPELGAAKRSLIAAQLHGEVRTREDAERRMSESASERISE